MDWDEFVRKDNARPIYWSWAGFIGLMAGIIIISVIFLVNGIKI